MHGKTSLAIVIYNNTIWSQSEPRKITFRCITFFLGVKHVLKLRMNKDKIILHPKFASRRPAFLFQNSFSGLNLTCQTSNYNKTSLAIIIYTTLFGRKTKRGKITFRCMHNFFPGCETCPQTSHEQR